MNENVTLDAVLASEVLSRLNRAIEIDATWHPLGFVRVNAQDMGDVRLRLHIWPRRNRVLQDPLWPVHTHAFELKSYIICGTVTNHGYKSVITRAGATNRLYRVIYARDYSLLEKEESRIRCEVVGKMSYNPGDTYAVPQNTLHTTVVPEETLAATLVTVSNRVDKPPLVVGDIDHPSPLSFQRKQCAPRLLRMWLRELAGYRSGIRT